MGNQASRSQVYDKYYSALATNRSSPFDMDPYDVLGLQKTFTWDELRDAYRRTARWVHPDKGGNKEMFEVVTECFKKLALEYKMRNADRPHHELKKEAESYVSEQPTSPSISHPMFSSKKTDSRDDANKNFQERFNNFFDENRIEDEENDAGYGAMMEKSTKNRAELDVPKIFSGKVSAKKFNKAFDTHTLPESREVIVHREPDAMQLAKKLQFTEIGGGKPDDFSHVPQTARQGLAYTDYKVATTSNRLVDPRAVKSRKEFKTVEDYNTYRSKVTEAPMTEEEMAWRAQKEREEKEKEEIRLVRMRERDQRYAVHYDRVSRGMIGGSGRF